MTTVEFAILKKKQNLVIGGPSNKIGDESSGKRKGLAGCG